MSTYARVILDSVHPVNGVRITTLELNYPYIIHAELMTHCIFSRNASSLRAIKTKNIVERVQADPFIPERFPRTARPDKGMEPDGYWPVGSDEHMRAELTWESAMRNAIATALELSRLGVHKQIASRPLMPYMYQRTLVTATEWENWDNLRGARHDSGAQDQIQELARAMLEARNMSLPESRWYHFPFMQPGEKPSALVSAGRCARISYLTHDGKAQPDVDEALGERLLKSGHMSPFGHLALAEIAQGADTWSKNFRGWVNYRATIPGEAVWKPPTT